LVVERAEALEPAGTGRLERDVVGDDLVERQPLADRDDDVLTDPAGHTHLLLAAHVESWRGEGPPTPSLESGSGRRRLRPRSSPSGRPLCRPDGATGRAPLPRQGHRRPLDLQAALTA